MKRYLTVLISVFSISAMTIGLGAQSVGAVTVLKKSGETSAAEETREEKETEAEELEDGTYRADFETDSSMFYVNEAKDGKGELTVKDGKMTIHISLNSKNIVNLFVGTAEDAQKDGAELLEPTTDEVTYKDGTTEEVYGFDVPVEKIGEEFDLALIGTKGKWYDHKVSVENPEKIEDSGNETETKEK